MRRSLLAGAATFVAWMLLDLSAHRFFLAPIYEASAGLALGAFLGLALGIASGFGTFIHMPIPLALAWGWHTGHAH